MPAPTYRDPGEFVDSDHPAVIAFAKDHTQSDASDIENAVALYYAVRDGWRYSPWNVRPGRQYFKASHVLTRDRSVGGHCIDKANVLAASARAVAIPSKLHFANVRNHIGTASLEAQLGTDLLVFHGYVELHLDGKWVAATPAFNKGLCDNLGVAPLEFDGREDSIFQPFDRHGGDEGRRFMEYVHDYGTFEDIPYEQMIEAWLHYYKPLRETGAWPGRPDG